MSIVGLRFLLLRKAKNKMATKKIVQGKGAKSPAVALIIGMSKPKGKATMMNKGGMAAFEKSGKDVEKKGMKEGSKADMALDKKQMMMNKGGMAKGKK